MLEELTVRNLAIIDDLSLRLGPGLNVLTGETGAGKSILVGALSLALGDRASAEWIRHGEKSAEVEAVFQINGAGDLCEMLEKEGLAEDARLIVRRVLSVSGPNRVYMNGRAAPASRLSEIGERLVSVFGQHEARGLLRPEAHLSILDEFGGLAVEREETARAYATLAHARRKFADLEKREAQSAARSDYLRFVAGEIEAAELLTDEDARLADRRRVLASAEKLASIAALIASECGDEEDSLAGRAGRLLMKAEEARKIDPAFDGIAQNVESVSIAAQEAARAAADYAESLEHDPDELRRIDDRLDRIRVLARKYGGSLEAALGTGEDARRELGEIESLGDAIKRAAEEAKAAETALIDTAKKLSAKRRKAASSLSKNIESELSELGMKGARFAAEFTPPPADAGLDAGGARIEESGAERGEFMLSANAGEAVKALAKIASGGELSRIMLAIKSSLAKAYRVPCLVFDEVDAGLGGAQAEIVGLKLKRVAAAHQVLCITHLPQIAGLADRHLVVSKSVVKGRTVTSVAELDDKGRERELARMLGGLEITDATRAAAREMMKAGARS